MDDASRLARTAGVVLCGGSSRRMGRPKAWLRFGPEVLLQRVVRILGQAVSPIAVVAGPDQDLPPLPDEVIVTRDPTAGRGPLQGIAGGLSAVAAHADAAFVSSCDTPFLQPAFVRAVVGALSGHVIAIPGAGGFHQTLAAAYRCSVLPAVEALLAADRLRPFFLFEKVNTRELTEDELRLADPALASLQNLNTPAEYEAALRELKSRPAE